MKYFLYILFCIQFFFSCYAQAQWSIVGSPSFCNLFADFIFIAIAPNEEPYVVYRDDYGRGWSKKFNGNDWITLSVNGFSVSDVSCTTMTFDTMGTPYVAYMDGTPGQGYRATVKKFDGNNWIAVGSPLFTLGAASYESIAIDGNNIPFVAFRDVFYNYRASVMKFDGTNWIYVGSPGFSPLGNDAGGALYTSLAIDKNTNTPYLAYSNFSDGFKATVLKFDGTNWVNVGSGVVSSGSANNTCIVIDSYGTPYIAYDDGAHNGKATVMKFDGTNWIPVGTAGFSPGMVQYISLALDKNNVPYVVFEDYSNGNKASVMTFDGSNWVFLGNAGFSPRKAMYTTIAVDSNNTVYIAYEGYDDSSTPTYTATVMKFTDIPTSINKVENKSSFNVYPNPTSRIITITITTTTPRQEYVLKVNDTSGKTVYTENLKDVSNAFTKQIDLSQFPKGIYFVKLQQQVSSAKIPARETKKIVLQ